MFKKRYAFLLLFPCLFLVCATARSATEYPLKVRIIQTQWHSSDWGVSGYGKANLYDGDVVTGFDYTYNCLRYFVASQGETFYEARWKKAGSRLMLSMVEIGKPTQHSECELSVALQTFVYGVKDGQLITYSRQQWDAIQKDRAMLKASLTPTDTDPSHYPLWVSLLESQWDAGAYGGFKGTGQGNIRLGQQYTAFEFSALCAGKLKNSVGSSGFRGKWVEQNSRLLLLTNNIDSGSKGQCELKTIVRPAYVFIRNSTTGIVSAITQADFQKTVQQANAANSLAESGRMSTQAASGAKAKVANADIIALVAAGISVPVIEAKIGASDCSFDTSAESLRQLKAAKVPDSVVLAMINCSAAPSGAVVPSAPPKTTSSAGSESKLSPCPKDSAAYWDNCTGTLAAAGTTYTGEWQRNKRNGYGTEVENGVVIRKGYWVDGVYKGAATPSGSAAR